MCLLSSCTACATKKYLICREEIHKSIDVFFASFALIQFLRRFDLKIGTLVAKAAVPCYMLSELKVISQSSAVLSDSAAMKIMVT